MTKDTSMRLHRIFNVILAVVLVIAGLGLIAGCLYIYFVKGEYSREIVAEIFKMISIPVYVSLAFILGGFIYEFVSPLKKKKEKPERDYAFQLSKLSEKKNFSECDKDVSKAISKAEKVRKILGIIRIPVVIICAVAFLVYGTNPENFHQSEINESMIGAMTVLCPCLFVSGAYCIFYEFFRKSSMKKEIELLKKLPDAKGSATEIKAEGKGKKIALVIVRIAVILIAAGALVYGALDGGFADVMTKAVNICTECIGLG